MTEITYAQWRRGFWQTIIVARFWHRRRQDEYESAILLAARILAAMPADARADCLRNLEGSYEFLILGPDPPKTP